MAKNLNLTLKKVVCQKLVSGGIAAKTKRKGKVNNFLHLKNVEIEKL